ncbi:unnamed protein product, partial [Meganyctiphanes norvegica]
IHTYIHTYIHIYIYVNCNLKPGDFPVCKLTAGAVLKSCKIDSSLAVSSLTFQPSSQPSDIRQSTSPTIRTSTPASNISTLRATDSVPTALPSIQLPITSIVPLTDLPPPIPASVIHLQSALPSTSMPSPVAKRTRSRFPYVKPAPKSQPPHGSPIKLLSQAMAPSGPAPIQISTSQFSPIPSPVASRTRKRPSCSPPLLCSQYPSPTAATGAIPKRLSRLNTKIARMKKKPYS